MEKHAYMIIAHNQFEILDILVKMLDDERNDIYIHIDKNSGEFNNDRILSLVKYSNVFFADRVGVTWGDYSQINCEMNLLKEAVKNSEYNNYSYYHLISGVDMPIKTNDEIYSFFQNNKGKEFVHFSNNTPLPEFENRIRYYHLFRKKRNLFFKIIAQLVLIIQKMLKINRLKKTDLVVQKGCNWFSITDDFAKYIVSKDEFIKRTFNFCYCGDEVFVQTMLVNSPFADNLYMPTCNDNHLACARHIDWNRGNPYTFKADDFDELINSKAMFARKFSLENKDIIYKIHNYVEERDHEE